MTIQILSEVSEFLDSLPEEDAAKVLVQLQSLALGQTEGLATKTLKGKIRELIVRQYRIVFFEISSKGYIATLAGQNDKNTMTKTKARSYNFISLDKAIGKKLKNERFRKTFAEEKSRLQLAHEIKALRQQRKMTQQQVAAKADMPQSVIARIESGTHSFSIATLHKIARVFDKQIGLVGQTQNRQRV